MADWALQAQARCCTCVCGDSGRGHSGEAEHTVCATPVSQPSASFNATEAPLPQRHRSPSAPLPLTTAHPRPRRPHTPHMPQPDEKQLEAILEEVAPDRCVCACVYMYACVCVCARMCACAPPKARQGPASDEQAEAPAAQPHS